MTSKNSGSSLVAVMIAVTFFTAIIGVVMNVTRTQSSNTHRAFLHSQAVAYGDAVLESLFDQWRNAMISATTADDRYNGRTNAYLSANLHEPTTANVPPPNGITLTNWSVVSATPMLKVSTREDGRPDPEQGTNSRLRIRLNYLARVQVAFTGPGVNDSVTLERPFVRGGRNLFDNFFFGTQPETEFHPGAPMYVDGSVYIGGNLYTAHDFLHFLTDVTYLGNHTLNYRDKDPRFGTTPTIDADAPRLANNWDTTKPPRQGSEQKLFDAPTDKMDPNFLDDPISNDSDSDGNANNDGYHELIEQPKPIVDPLKPDPLKLDPSTSERLSENADYLIVVDKDNNLVVQKFKEDAVTKELKPEDLATSSDEYKAIQGAVTLDTAVKDIRQGENTRLVTLDIAKVKTASDTGKISDNIGSGDGLLIYVSDTSVGTSVNTKVKNSSTGATTNVTAKARGVKLINGAKLPAKGLTIATPHPAYIQGDYNSGKTSSTQPASNTASSYTPPNDKPSSTVTGYERAPSAVAADAVNILSNAWNDANSLTAKSTRTASNTTVNTAIISGNVPSIPGSTGSYSGGIENFVRFHENWDTKYFTIYGTLASLFNSQQATQPWSKADYSPPNRRWYYDTHFQDNNPPGFKVAREYVRGTWTIR